MGNQLTFILPFRVDYHSLYKIENKQVDRNTDAKVVVIIIENNHSTRDKLRLVCTVAEVEISSM